MNRKVLKLPDGKLIGEGFHVDQSPNSSRKRLSKLFGEEH
jgi:hypothetical protein